VEQNTAQVISVSYDGCEQYMGSAELEFFNSLWQRAALQGQSVFVASGDSGAAACDPDTAAFGTQAGVNGVCSSPYSTCVGGTLFNDTASPSTYWSSSDNALGASARSYIPEVVWNESASNGGDGLWASGGGVSLVYPRPSWQPVATASDGQRGVPDVALTAAEHDGYAVYETTGGFSSWYTFWGTSAATPSFAGIVALVCKANASSANASNANAAAGLGNVNPILYGLASGSATVFHPTVSGNNGVPDVAGYSATKSTYNLATGLGSVDGKQLIAHWASGSGLPSFALQPASNSLVIASGADRVLPISVTSVSSAMPSITTPSVAIACTAPTGVTVNFSASTVEASPTAETIAAVIVDSMVPVGNYTLVFTGTSSSGTPGSGINSTVESAEVALTVTAAPLLSITAASRLVQLAHASSAALQLDVATNAAFSGNVQLAVSNLPAGVSATWSSQTLTPAGGAATAILTLYATAAANATSATIVVTARGDNLQASDAITVEVTRAEHSPILILKPNAARLSSGSNPILGPLQPVAAASVFLSTPIHFVAGKVTDAGVEFGCSSGTTGMCATRPLEASSMDTPLRSRIVAVTWSSATRAFS
jgi:hypothetical protein